MAKLVNESVVLHRNGGFKITAFIWRKRLYKVEDVIGWWREAPMWWLGEPVRCFLRVTARSSSIGVFELCKVNGEWFLYRVLD
jgi:hypothetical protein